MQRRWIAALVLCVGTFAVADGAYAQDGSFVSGSRRLYFTTIGAGAPVVVLSGGPGFDVGYMRPVAEAMPGRQSIMFEQRGTGRSRGTPLTADEMTLATAVADLDALRQHLKQPRLTLVGHSWGAMLAMSYAAAHPDRIDRMILIGSGGPTLEFAMWFEDNIRARLRPEDAEAERYWTAAAARGVAADKVALETARALTPAYFFDRAKGLAFAATMAEGELHADVGNLLFPDLMKHYDVRAGLRRLDRPTLIVHGHQDPMGDKNAEDIHALVKSSTIVYLDKCGHFPWVEQPDAFRAALASFMAAAVR
jgi:proline iminopeptidase